MKNQPIFITWAPSYNRSTSLANEIGFKPVFIGHVSKHSNSFAALWDFFSWGYENFKLIKNQRPSHIALANTHVVVASVNYFIGKLFGAKIILDSHSAAFDAPFYKYPKFLSYFFAKNSLFSIVTNEIHQKIIEKHGGKAFLLPDIPNDEQLLTYKKEKISEKFSICFICTYNYDEPFEEVLKAANAIPEVQFFFTGNYMNKIKDPGKYENVKFTGFLPDEDYKNLINNVDALLVLTTRENTMQHGGSEAISIEKPFITSKTNMLQSYFKMGAVFVSNDKKGIIQGISEMRNNYLQYKIDIKEMKKIRNKTFLSNIQEIKQQLSNG